MRKQSQNWSGLQYPVSYCFNSIQKQLTSNYTSSLHKLPNTTVLTVTDSYWGNDIWVGIFNDSQAAKWEKSIIPSCHCLEIHRVEAVSQKKKKKKSTQFKNYGFRCEILGVFKKRYFVKHCLIKVRIWKFFCTYVIHRAVIIYLTEK